MKHFETNIFNHEKNSLFEFFAKLLHIPLNELISEYDERADGSEDKEILKDVLAELGGKELTHLNIDNKFTICFGFYDDTDGGKFDNFIFHSLFNSLYYYNEKAEYEYDEYGEIIGKEFVTSEKTLISDDYLSPSDWHMGNRPTSDVICEILNIKGKAQNV